MVLCRSSGTVNKHVVRVLFSYFVQQNKLDQIAQQLEPDEVEEDYFRSVQIKINK